MTRTSNGSYIRLFEPIMWSTPEKLDRRPLQLFEVYVKQRPAEMCQLHPPFYLAVNSCPVLDKRDIKIKGWEETKLDYS